ncbi:MAG: hypothetical protein U1F36_16825 [Planctomycetota bacterium]
MTDDPKKCGDSRVWCHRLERLLPKDEHARCPYCYGTDSQIASGRHPDFCDFEKERDPIVFGFPPDSSRNLES